MIEPACGLVYLLFVENSGVCIFVEQIELTSVNRNVGLYFRFDFFKQSFLF